MTKKLFVLLMFACSFGEAATVNGGLYVVGATTISAVQANGIPYASSLDVISGTTSLTWTSSVGGGDMTNRGSFTLYNPLIGGFGSENSTMTFISSYNSAVGNSIKTLSNGDDFFAFGAGGTAGTYSTITVWPPSSANSGFNFAINASPILQITTAGTSVQSGFLQLVSQTSAQIRAITPTLVNGVAIGEYYYCSDCATVPQCVSTGTARGAFALTTNRTSVCQ